MAFSEDLDVFFDTVNGFAEEVTFDGDPVAMIFDAAFFEDELGAAGVESTRPAALAKVADVGEAPHDSLIVRGGVTYKVVGNRPDGTGLTLLILEEQ